MLFNLINESELMPSRFTYIWKKKSKNYIGLNEISGNPNISRHWIKVMKVTITVLLVLNTKILINLTLADKLFYCVSSFCRVGT